MNLVDQFGKPFKLGDVSTPQTCMVRGLENELIESQLDGLTPAKAGRIMREADNGDITAQFQLFDDLLDRDAHMACEFGKRTGSVAPLDFRMVPPRDANRAEKKDAAWVEEVLKDVVDDFEDIISSLHSAVGYGFTPVEQEWQYIEREFIPTFHPRPQTWFKLTQNRHELHLNDRSPDGLPLTPFGWIVHKPNKPKTGYISRSGLCRVLVWPFMYKAYSVGDFSEFLETYGLPIIMGKYFNGASDAEKSSLMRAVSDLGRDARAIMPQEMQIEINKIASSGDGTPHLAMAEWADRAESKAILGQTLSADAQSTGLGSGVADLHGLVRDDIRKSDAKKLAATITRDIVYPILTLNGRGSNNMRRCPRLVFDDGRKEDMESFSKSLPELSKGGMMIPVNWAHEKLGIPMAQESEAVFGATENSDGEPPVKAAMTALKGKFKAPNTPEQKVKQMASTMAKTADKHVHGWVDDLSVVLDKAGSLEEARAMLAAMYDNLDTAALVDDLSAGIAAATLRGQSDVEDGQ